MARTLVSLQDVSPEAQTVARWLSGEFQRSGKWPTARQAIVFCRRNNLFLEEVRREEWRPVDEFSRGNESEISLAPWALYDSDGYFRTLYQGAHAVLVKHLADVVERNGETTRLVWSQVAEAAGIAVTDVTHGQIRWLLEKSRFGVRDDAKDGAYVEVTAYYLRDSIPSLDEFFLSRPARHDKESSDLASMTPGKAGRQHQTPQSFRPTPWVFLASTWEDLKTHRRGVRDAIAKAKCLPLGMEDWSADTRPSLERSLEEVAQADLMVVVVGCRYGSVVGTPEKSFTETEYDQAKTRELGVLAFLPARDTQWTRDAADPENANKLNAFMQRLRGEGHVSEYSNVSNLQYEVHAALVDWKSRR